MTTSGLSRIFTRAAGRGFADTVWRVQVQAVGVDDAQAAGGVQGFFGSNGGEAAG